MARTAFDDKVHCGRALWSFSLVLALGSVCITGCVDGDTTGDDETTGLTSQAAEVPGDPDIGYGVFPDSGSGHETLLIATVVNSAIPQSDRTYDWSSVTVNRSVKVIGRSCGIDSSTCTVLIAPWCTAAAFGGPVVVKSKSTSDYDIGVFAVHIPASQYCHRPVANFTYGSCIGYEREVFMTVTGSEDASVPSRADMSDDGGRSFRPQCGYDEPDGHEYGFLTSHGIIARIYTDVPEDGTQIYIDYWYCDPNGPEGAPL